jgi:hypothetical protein
MISADVPYSFKSYAVLFNRPSKYDFEIIYIITSYIIIFINNTENTKLLIVL